MKILQGKRALVCGSTQGIGLACATAFADAGAGVTLLARNPASLKEAAGKLPAGPHDWLVADFQDPDGVRDTVSPWLDQNGPVHILVNNTGGPPGGPIIEARGDEFEQAFAAHLLCNQYLAQLVVPGMRSLGYGRIINIISTSVKQPIAGLGVSNTIRGAVASWSKTLAGEVGRDGITVNNVLPGATRTGRHESLMAKRSQTSGMTIEKAEAEARAGIPLGRFAEPAEIAAAVLFLASPAASYISGISLPVDGGRMGCL